MVLVVGTHPLCSSDWICNCSLCLSEILTGKRGMLEVMIDYDKKVKEGRQMGELSGYLNNSFSTKKGFKKYI